jgi:hypothetical protein
MRTVRTEKYGIDQSTCIRDAAVHFVVYSNQSVRVEKIPGETGLIGRNDHMPSGTVKIGDCFKAAGYRNPFLRRFYIRSGVFIDDTITIENDQLHGSRLRGATLTGWKRPVLAAMIQGREHV